MFLLTETWLKKEEPAELNRKFDMDTYSAHRPIKTGGGALIACSKEIDIEKSLNFSDEELSYAVVYSPNLNIFLGSVYLKPECNYKNAIQALQDIRNFVVEGPEDAKVVIYGDWNLNCLECKRERSTRKFWNHM